MSVQSVITTAGLLLATTPVAIGISIAVVGMGYAGDIKMTPTYTFTAAPDVDDFFSPPSPGYYRFYARFTTHVPPADAGDKFGCKRFVRLAASMDKEDVTEFLRIGLGLFSNDLKLKSESWQGTESVEALHTILPLRVALPATVSKDVALKAYQSAGVQSKLVDSYGYPVIVLTSTFESAQAITRDNAPEFTMLLKLRAERAIRVEGRIQYEMRLRAPYLWHEAAVDLRFFDGPEALSLAELSKSLPVDGSRLASWGEDLAVRINSAYADILQRTDVKRLADVQLAPDEERLTKFGSIVQTQWVALLAAKCTAALESGG